MKKSQKKEKEEMEHKSWSFDKKRKETLELTDKMIKSLKESGVPDEVTETMLAVSEAILKIEELNSKLDTNQSINYVSNILTYMQEKFDMMVSAIEEIDEKVAEDIVQHQQMFRSAVHTGGDTEGI